MATQTDLDRLQIAWQRLQKAVNDTIPNTTSRIQAARNRMSSGGGGSGPKPQ